MALPSEGASTSGASGTCVSTVKPSAAEGGPSFPASSSAMAETEAGPSASAVSGV